MEDTLVGKKFVYILKKDDNPRVISSVENGVVIFDDGVFIPINSLYKIFEESSNHYDVENIQNVEPNPVVKYDFSDSGTNLHNSIISQIDNAHANQKSSQNNYQNQQTVVKRIHSHEEVVSTEPMTHDVRKIELDRTEDGEYINTTNATTGQLLEASIFKKMKRTNPVELKFVVTESIPNTEFIRMMDENFNEGVLDFLVEDIAKKWLNNPSIVRESIKEQLKYIVYGKKKPIKKRTSRTTKSNTTQSKKEIGNTSA